MSIDFAAEAVKYPHSVAKAEECLADFLTADSLARLGPEKAAAKIAYYRGLLTAKGSDPDQAVANVAARKAAK